MTLTNRLFGEKIESLKIENDDLINFTVFYRETRIFLMGELIEDGINIGFYPSGTLATCFIPTKKGYESAEWKKMHFYSKNEIDLTEELLENLLPYITDKKVNSFSRPTVVSVASVVANHSNEKLYSEYTNK